LFGFFQVVSDHQNPCSAVGKFIDHPPHGTPGQRVHTGGGLIQKDRIGLMHHRCTKCDTLFPTSRQTTRQQISLTFESRDLKHPLLLLLAFSAWHLVNTGEEVEVLFNSQIVVERKLLRHVTNALSDGTRPQTPTLSSELHLSTRRANQTAKHLDRCRLSSTILPKQCQNFPGLDIKRDTIHCPEIIIKLLA